MLSLSEEMMGDSEMGSNMLYLKGHGHLSRIEVLSSLTIWHCSSTNPAFLPFPYIDLLSLASDSFLTSNHGSHYFLSMFLPAYPPILLFYLFQSLYHISLPPLYPPSLTTHQHLCISIYGFMHFIRDSPDLSCQAFLLDSLLHPFLIFHSYIFMAPDISPTSFSSPTQYLMFHINQHHSNHPQKQTNTSF